MARQQRLRAAPSNTCSWPAVARFKPQGCVFYGAEVYFTSRDQHDHDCSYINCHDALSFGTLVCCDAETELNKLKRQQEVQTLFGFLAGQGQQAPTKGPVWERGVPPLGTPSFMPDGPIGGVFEGICC